MKWGKEERTRNSRDIKRIQSSRILNARPVFGSVGIPALLLHLNCWTAPAFAGHMLEMQLGISPTAAWCAHTAFYVAFKESKEAEVTCMHLSACKLVSQLDVDTSVTLTVWGWGGKATIIVSGLLISVYSLDSMLYWIQKYKSTPQALKKA